MIRTGQAESKAAEPATAKRSFACWNEDPQTQAIRVELNSGNFFIFPTAHFLSAEFSRDEGEDSLKLLFTTHGVAIRGKHLREVALGLQKLAVEWIKEIAPKYAALAEPNAAVILSIQVAAAEETGPPEPEQGSRSQRH